MLKTLKNIHIHTKLLEIIKKFRKVEEYKINVQNSVASLYTSNEQSKSKIKKTIPLK